MLVQTRKGLYCPNGDFYIDPSGAVDRAVITHAHSDHARRGAKEYFCVHSGVGLLKARLGQKINVRSFKFAETFQLGDVKISFHPAGHILGSSQVRLEYGGQVWVASGDYKRDFDPTCEPFESVPCDVFITEATFGTPGFRWNKSADLGKDIYEWWQQNAQEGYNSIVFAYSLGKTQRVLGVIEPYAQEPIYLHPAATPLTDCYRYEGVSLADTVCLSEVDPNELLHGKLIVGPPGIQDKYPNLFGRKFRCAFASGWTAQGSRGYTEYEKGFVMSDHADWDDLLRTVQESKARTVYVQHRGNGALVRHLKSMGIDAHPVEKLESTGTSADQLQLF